MSQSNQSYPCGGGMMEWRVGRKVPLNVYEGDRPVCQCHTPEDAAFIVKAVNDRQAASVPEHLRTGKVYEALQEQTKERAEKKLGKT